jgi:membrane fusion protein (multidrug efflux system)
MTRTALPPGKPSFNKGGRRRVIDSMDLTRLTGSISGSAVLLFLFSLLFSGCKKTEQVPHETPTLIYEQPVTMDIPVKGSWVGHLDGVDNAAILPQVTGYLLTQNYANGALVKKGEVLFRIDDSTFKDQVARAKATLEQAQAQLQQLNYDMEIYKPLAAENAISKQKYEDTRLSAIAAQAQVQQATAALALAEKNLSYTVLYAPFDGIAGISKTNIGDLVSPESGPLAVVSSVNPIRVNFAVTQQEWIQQAGKNGDEGVQTGSKLDITLKDGTKYPEQATVVAIDRAFNPQTGTIRVQADLPNGNYLLRPGMFITATAKLATVKNALTVPSKALLSTQGRFFVIALDERDHPSIIPVQAGTQVGERQQVIPLKPDSLTPQSKVVVDGLLQAEMASRNPAAHLKAVPASNP